MASLEKAELKATAVADLEREEMMAKATAQWTRSKIHII